MFERVKRRYILSGLALTATIGVLSNSVPASAASWTGGPSFSSMPPRASMPTVTVPQPPATMPTPPVITPPPVMHTPPVMPVPPTHTGVMNINPKDVTGNIIINPDASDNADALHGIQKLAGGEFPRQSDVSANGDFLLVRGEPGARFTKHSNAMATIDSGAVLVSVRRPTRVALVKFPFGQIGLTGDADLMITAGGRATRIVNLSGRGQSVKVKLDSQPTEQQNANVIALAPGYELVAGSQTLTRADVRIADGFARRHFKVLEGGRVAVSEISVESILTSSAIVAQVVKDDSSKERRVVADMSKMAAVLNYLNGTQGFSTDGTNTALAHHQ